MERANSLEKKERERKKNTEIENKSYRCYRPNAPASESELPNAGIDVEGTFLESYFLPEQLKIG